MAAVTVHSDFGAQGNKICHCIRFFPFYLPWSDRTGCHYLSFWMMSFKPAFSLPSFTLIKRLFSSSSLSVIRVASSAYLRLLVFLPEILIPACDSSCLAFHMMHSAWKLNKHSDNIQPWPTPFPILNQSIVHVQFCRFLNHIQVSQETGKMVWYSHLFKNFPQFVLIHTGKGFSVVPLLSLWSRECWQFDLWFLCLM